MDAKQLRVLRHLHEAESTVDEFVTSLGLYVNSWAPTFTYLRKEGLVERTGNQRKTTHGALAHVLRLTPAGRDALYGR